MTVLFSPFYKLRDHAIVVAIFATTICALVVALYAGPAVVLVADAHATSLVLGAATGPHGSAQELCKAAAAHGSCNITVCSVLVCVTLFSSSFVNVSLISSNIVRNERLVARGRFRTFSNITL